MEFCVRGGLEIEEGEDNSIVESIAELGNAIPLTRPYISMHLVWLSMTLLSKPVFFLLKQFLYTFVFANFLEQYRNFVLIFFNYL